MKRVIVTGAASGIGQATADLLRADGVEVIAADLSEDAAHPIDVSDPTAWEELASGFDRIDGLVNAAGITQRSRLGDVSREDFERVMAVNAAGALYGIQAVMPRMPRGGSIVNVISLAALAGHYTVAYTASKWALRGITRTASMELGPRGIRVNGVFPGYIDTPMTRSAPDVFRDANVRLASLERVGEPAEVAALCRFLLSDDAAFITGAEIAIDGGFSGHGGAKVLSDALKP